MIIQFVIGDDQPLTPSNGTSTYNSPLLLNQNFTIQKNGLGFWFEGIDFSRVYYGGFKLLNGGVFTTGESYSITIL